jgi:hypothetical protein
VVDVNRFDIESKRYDTAGSPQIKGAERNDSGSLLMFLGRKETSLWGVDKGFSQVNERFKG